MYKFFTGIIGLILMANLGTGNASATTIKADTAQAETIIKKVEKGVVKSSSRLRYDKNRKVWVPYVPHIMTTKKKKNFGVPIFNDVKKRAPTIE
jgi:CRISPR/Cas system CSM-associated protein Csm4 (group 5 of RAMP superfamily)